MNIFFLFIGFFSLLYAITSEIHFPPYLFFLFLITFGTVKTFSLFKDIFSRSPDKNKTWIRLFFRFLFTFFIYFLCFYLLSYYNINTYELKKLSYSLFFSGNLFFKATLLFCLFILLWTESSLWGTDRFQIRKVAYSTVFLIGWTVYDITNQKSAATHIFTTSISKKNSSSKAPSGLLAGAGVGASFAGRRRNKAK